VREQRAASVGRVADAQGDARGEGGEGGREGVGEQEREVEAAAAQVARLCEEGGGAPSLAAEREEFIDEVGTLENPLGPRARRQRDVRAGQDAAQLPERRHRHHGVAHPVRAAHDDALDPFGLKATFPHGKSLTWMDRMDRMEKD
jgi:hypothetical protein